MGSAAVRWWMSTLDYKVAYYDRAIDPVFPECRGQKIYIFWHEYILFPLYLRGHCNLAMLLSRHRDAEILSHAAHHLGFDFVRGSTNRGGVAAIRELLAKSRTHAPDDHARRPARPAAAFGPRLRLPGLETGIAAGGDGLRLRSALAGAKRLGPVRHSPSSLAARAMPSGEIFVPPDSGPRRARTFPPEDRAAAESSDRRSRSLGRLRRPQDRPEERPGTAYRAPAIAPAATATAPTAALATVAKAACVKRAIRDKLIEHK